MEEKDLVLAGGCFWGMEKLFRQAAGVTDLQVGYAQGKSQALANYRDVCTGLTGFREALALRYDPARLSLKRILFLYYAVIDPTMFHRQGMDLGSQYQTGIYWSDRETAETVLAVSTMERAARREFYVELEPLRCFYPAEDYHQAYLEKVPDGYCHIAPAKMADVLGMPWQESDYVRPAAELLADFRRRTGR